MNELLQDGFFYKMRNMEFDADAGRKVLKRLASLNPDDFDEKGRKDLVIALHDLPFAMRSWLPGCVEMGADHAEVIQVILDFRRVISEKIKGLLGNKAVDEQPDKKGAEVMPASVEPSRLRLRRKAVPAYLASTHGVDVAVSTLAKLATNGGGPAMQYSGRIPLYAVKDLDEWATDRLSTVVRSTSEKKR